MSHDEPYLCCASDDADDEDNTDDVVMNQQGDIQDIER